MHDLSDHPTTLHACQKTKEAYAATIVYVNEEVKTVGNILVKVPTMAALNTAVTAITGNTSITTAIGAGVYASLDSSADTFSCTLKYHHSNGELFSATIKGKAFRSPVMRLMLSGLAWRTGPIRSAFSPDIHFFQEPAEMKWFVVLCMIGGTMMLGITVADLISSSILCDGATFTSSEVTCQDRTYGALFFTTDRANISRDLALADGVNFRIQMFLF